MASRTGLMPAVKTEGRSHFSKAPQKVVRKSHVEGHFNKTAPCKSASLSNTSGKVQNPERPRPSASHESVLKTSSSMRTASTTRPSTVVVSGNKGKKSVRPLPKVTLKRKSDRGCPSTQKPSSTTDVKTPARKSIPAVTVRRTPKSILKKEPDTQAADQNLVHHQNDCDSRHVKFKTKATQQESLRAKLNAWLETKGKTPSRCRHLMCFDAEMSAKKKKAKLVDRTISQNLLSQQDKALQKEEVKKQLFTDSDLKQTNVRPTATADGKENQRETERCPNSPGLRTDANGVQEESTVKMSPIPEVSSHDRNISDKAIFDNLKSMLDECLTLFYSGCPLESILPWLMEMETHIPKTLSYAPFYICKAKVLRDYPPQVLEVYCEAIRNNAQPSDLLAEEMKAAVSQWLIPPTPPNVLELARDAMLSNQQPSPYLSDIESSCDINMRSVTPPAPCSTPGRASSPKRRRLHSEGSVVKYSITSTTPLLRHTPEITPLAVVTPVRRSNRLSHRQSTPGAVLRREVNSVSDLGSGERKSMLFRENPALTGE